MRKLPDNNSGRKAYVYEYEFDTDAEEGLNVLKLCEYDKEWLDFITPNRHGGEGEMHYDLVYDRMADNAGDELTANIEAYWSKEKSADGVLKAIRFTDSSYDQYCFKTQEALKRLRRIKRLELSRLNGKLIIQ